MFMSTKMIPEIGKIKPIFLQSIYEKKIEKVLAPSYFISLVFVKYKFEIVKGALSIRPRLDVFLPPPPHPPTNNVHSHRII